MFKYQCSMLNECTNAQCFNALNHCLIDHSLKIDNCKLSIKPTSGGVLC